MNKYLITGATSDIGKALILSLNNENSEFFLQVYSNYDSLKEFCKENSVKASFFSSDFSKEEDIDSFVLEIKNLDITHFIHLPALAVVNTKFKNFDEDLFKRDFNVQILSAVKISKAILPAMAKNKFGRVLFMSTSYTLSNPPKNTASYIMNKTSLNGLMKSLAADYVSFGVTVNAVSPSMIETNFLANTSHLIVEAAAAAHPLKRNATVNDVVPAMAFLLSNDAGFITGVNLPITGGSVIE